MKGKGRIGIFFMLVCLLLGSQRVWAQEGSTAITVTVPQQPEEKIEAAAGAAALKDVPLPQGWEWKDGSIALKPGGSVTGTAVYRDGDGSILVERSIVVNAPERRNVKYEPVSGNDSVWNGEKDAGISIKVPEDVGRITKVTVDGKELSADDYTVSGNPPTVTLTPEYLKTLGDGTHTVLIQGENGYVEVTFTVAKESDAEETTAITEKQTTGSGQSKGVKTGDETDFVSWIEVMLLSLGILLAAGIRLQGNEKQ